GAFAVFCASGCVGVDAWIAARVQARGGVANVVDKPRLCSAITPSLVDRDPLVVAIGTEGVAPVLGQRVKTAVETALEPGLGAFLQGLRALRPRMMERALAPSRRAFWNWIMDGPRARAAGGDLDGALAEVAAALEAGGVPQVGGAPQVGRAGRLTLIGLPEAADLLPLRAVRRLQEADLVLHPPGRGAEVLELARRDAEREAAQDWAARAVEAQAEGLDVAVLCEPQALGAGPAGAERLGPAAGL
ncbi:MAG: SAM-dependent methyltransferase, partial [Pseudomonadota bacterium]